MASMVSRLSARGGINRIVSLAGLLALVGCGGDDAGGGGSGAGASGGTGAAAGAGGASGSGGTAGNLTGGSGGGGAMGGAGGAGGTAGAGGTSCHGAPATPGDVVRLVVSHPYQTSGMPSPRYELVEVDGVELTRGPSFELTRNFLGEIVFTPDGQIGFVADDDGGLSVFRLTESGPEVVHAPLEAEFYAGKLVVAPDGGTLYVQDVQWRENGGGLYALNIACDGTLSNERKLFESKLPYGFAFNPTDTTQALLYARDVGSSSVGQDLHAFTWGQAPVQGASVTIFGDEEAQVSSLVFTQDGRFALMGDTAGFSTVPNRVGIARVGGGTLSLEQVLTPIEDPLDLVTSPYNNAALIVSGFGEQLIGLDYDPNGSPAFSLRGELAYSDSGPELPGFAVSINSGPGRGKVFVAETSAVRVLQFEANGQITDLGVLEFGDGLENAVGSIGLVP